MPKEVCTTAWTVNWINVKFLTGGGWTGRRVRNSLQLEAIHREGMMPTRTTHRSRSGSKLYALRDKLGRFKDI
jgi:hypothetical protein